MNNDDDLTPTGVKFMPLDSVLDRLRVLQFNMGEQVLIFGRSDPRTLEPAILHSILRREKKLIDSQ